MYTIIPKGDRKKKVRSVSFASWQQFLILEDYNVKKDFIRDYATEAFRYYASIGKTFEEVKEEIYRKAIEESKKEVIEKKGELEDLLAVEETIKQLVRERNGLEINKAIELVYFIAPEKELGRNEFSSRVLNAAQEIHCDERTVYRYLGKARNIFAENRGLRKANKHIS